MKTRILQGKILLTILFVCVLMLGFSGIGATTVHAAESGTCGDNLTWTLDDNGVMTISGTGAMTNYSTESGQTAPWNDYTVKSIVIENGVTHIGNYAFSHQYELTSVSIPNSVISIGGTAFFRCWKLPDVTIPSSVTSIERYAFYDCSKLKLIIFEGNTPPTLGTSAIGGSLHDDFTISVPQGATGYWNTDWSRNDTHHWHECALANCTITNNSKKDGYAEHDFNDTTHECICGATNHSYDATTHECECGATNHTFDAETQKCTCGAVLVNEKSFPDANFRAYIFGKSFGTDGILTAAEIATIKDIIVKKQNIASLKGIEYFTALKTLNCGENLLETLDISKNTALEELRCYTNQLTSLDVSKNTALTLLQCYNNQLTSLDVSNNKALVYLYCQENKLTNLDLSQNTEITSLYCQNNQLISLDLTANTGIADSFDISGQSAKIAADITNKTVTLPADVDMSKVTVTSGATLNGDVLELDTGATEVVYTYATGLSSKILTVTLKVIPTFESLNISIGKDIKVNYYVTKIDGFATQVKFTINDYTKTVDGIADGEEYKFIFDGVAPHWLGDTIKAELIVDGAVIAEKEYTVLEYLNELKTMTASALGYSEAKHTAMLALINNILVYGGAAQAYTGHNADTPVSDGITGTPFEPLTGTHKNVAHGNVVTFKNATLFFDSTNELRFRFTAASTEGLTFGLSINGGAEADIAYTAEGGQYLIKTDAIYATGFDDVYTLTAYVNGEKDAELTYSVKSYVYAKQGGDSNMAKLAEATYNYGLAAQAFINADNTAGA